MEPFYYILAWCFLALTGNGGQTETNRYYHEISAQDFSGYDSTRLVVKSKYGNVYHSVKREKSGYTLGLYVFEKIEQDKKTIFEMDELTQIGNDSTFMLCEPPLKIVGDTTNWINGIWFYANMDNTGTTHFNVDSMPKKIPAMDYKNLKMGIYQCVGNKLVKISENQSGDTFYAMKPTGFFFLPNPGFFYTLTGFKDIK